MQNPVFKLEKVVRSKSEEEMQDFEGPLDLILYLLGKNKMEIQDISISLICDQYMAWLARRQEMDLEVASEFVTMASQLVYIKTRMLLSIEDEEAQSEMDALIASLEERKRNENYAKVKVRPSSRQTYRGYIDNHIKPDIGEVPLEKLTSLELQKVCKKLLNSGERSTSTTRHRRTWSWPWPRSRAGRSGPCRRPAPLSRASSSTSPIPWRARPGRF